jgi:DNA modification methylase
MENKLTWHTEQRKVKDLVPWEHNPRKLTEEQAKQLDASLDKFDLVEIPAINTDNKLVAGHQRVMRLMLRNRGEETIDVRVPSRELSTDEFREYNLRSNKNTGEWDWEKLKDFERDLLKSIGFAEAEIKRGLFQSSNEISRKLTEDYIIPPFSIFDAKQKYWQDRKRDWIRQIGDSTAGRPDDLIGGLKNAGILGGISEGSATGINKTGTSEFDPVLCEVLYTWYVDKGGLIIDPFAGGNVRGAIAGIMGYKYIGTDLSAEQVAANQKADEIVKSGANWVHADGLDLNQNVKPGSADFLITCPPYFDLEQYTKNPDDLSNKGTYAEFRDVYAEILKRTFPLLKPGAFATIVVGNVRGEEGYYHDLVGDTVRAMESAGYRFYNEIILATALAAAAMRARRIFDAGKKVVKVHQNVLTFWKEDKEIKVSDTIRHLLETGTTAKAHENVLMFKKP